MKDEDFEKIQELERYYEFQLLLYNEKNKTNDNSYFQKWLEGTIDGIKDVLEQFE